MINILYFDSTKICVEDIVDTCKQIKKVLPEDLIIALPYGVSMLTDVPLQELKDFRDSLNTLIEGKEKENDI